MHELNIDPWSGDLQNLMMWLIRSDDPIYRIIDLMIWSDDLLLTKVLNRVEMCEEEHQRTLRDGGHGRGVHADLLVRGNEHTLSCFQWHLEG